MRRDAKGPPSAGPTLDSGTRHVVLPLFFCACAVAVLLGLQVGSASATITHSPEPFSPLTGAGSGLTLRYASGVAVDEATGNVFVTDGYEDGEQASGRIAILGGEGGAPVGLASPFEISGVQFFSNAHAGLAYDNAVTGTLYAYDPSNRKVKKYVRNPATEKFEPTGEITLPREISARNSGLSVDGAGNLYVGVTIEIFGLTEAWIFKFNSSGVLTAEYDFSGPPESALVRPEAFAVDSTGDLFVGGSLGLYEVPADETGEIDPTVYTEIVDGSVGGVAYDPTTNHVYASVGGRMVDIDSETGATVSEFGSEEFRFTPGRVAFDAATKRIYVADSSGFPPSAGKPSTVHVFGPAVVVPTVKANAATDITGSKAVLNGSVDPEGIAVEDCFFEWGLSAPAKGESYEHTTACGALPPADSEAHPVSADISGLTANGTTYHFRLVATNENGEERSPDKTLVTGNTVETREAIAIGPKAATLQGIVRPEGEQFTGCVFEYGLTTSDGFESTVPCNPPAATIESDFQSHAVSAALTGLASNSTYKFRLTATNSEGTLSGKVLTFTTQGPPQITELRASFADQTSATLEAKINPSGFATNYRFEWGPTTAYGNSVPAEFEPFVGSGEVPVRVSAKISGLSAATTYHFRVVATNSVDVTQSPDRTLETLNSCGLFEGRCFELVSPRDAGPVARPGRSAGEAELNFQAASQAGALAYVVETGFPGATKGAEILYKGTRDSGGWGSTQLSPPFVARDETSEASSASSRTLGLSDDLSCDIFESSQPLTDDASTRLVIEAGGANLYRHNPDGSYTAITKLAPENPGAGDGVVGTEYPLAGFSQDCGKVLFTAPYRYPGVPGGENKTSGGERLYEWDEGTLRGVGFVPGPSGEVEVEAIAGSGLSMLEGNHTHVVSDDGSRVFFSAQRQISPNPAEIGTMGIFVREDGGASIRDLSLSETASPNEGATFQWATRDGSKVFFTANAGLTAESSDSGTDLYEYDLESEDLTDLTPNGGEGAGVGGFIGASEDGSHVYFVAKGQLVPGKGKTFAQNESDDTYSVFGVKEGEVGYAGVVSGGGNPGISEEGLLRVIATSKRVQTARVSPDGRYLLFESRLNVTGYDGGERVTEAYLYDAEASTEATICVSCRQDGKVSVTPNLNEPLARGWSYNPLHAPRTLIAPNGEPRVFFTSSDRLASGAVEGETNLYAWSHGQVFHIATEPPGLHGPAREEEVFGHLLRSTEKYVTFLGASSDGTDLYLATPETLTWEDGDERFSVYSARIGGGFPEPPPPPSPCDPDSEGSCQAPAQSGTPTPSPASLAFSGPGNAKPKSRHGKKRHKRHHKKRKGKRKQAKRGNAARHANGNGRAGK